MSKINYNIISFILIIINEYNIDRNNLGIRTVTN